MSKYQSLQKVAYCNPDKSTDLIACSESVLEVLQECPVAQGAALERLFYLVMSLEGLEHKIKRGIIPPRDPVKLDLEFNVKKCLNTINGKIHQKSYSYELICVVMSWCFKTFSKVNDDFKLWNTLNKVISTAADSIFKENQAKYVDKVFDIFAKECPTSNSSVILGKVLHPYPSLIPDVVRRCFTAYVDKAHNFSVYKSLISDLSQYNCNQVSSAVMTLLENESDINHKIGFVLNVLQSIPSLQTISIMLLYESHAFKKLMNSPKGSLSSNMLDDLAKLFMHSQVNSYSSVMSLLEQDSPQALGPTLLEKILLNLELAVFGVRDSDDKTISFIENMSSETDTKMFCNCLSLMKPASHPYILKCLAIICIYKDHVVTKSIISYLMLTQPLDKYESLINQIVGIYPTIAADCFRSTMSNLTVCSDDKISEIYTFFENAEKLKLHSTQEMLSSDMVATAIVLRETDNYKYVMLLLQFLDPKPIDITHTVQITNLLTESFVKFVSRIHSQHVRLEHLEVIEDLKNNILKWCAIKDCVKISVLRYLLQLITNDDSLVSDVPAATEDKRSSLLSLLKSSIIESDEDTHSGRIRKRHKPKTNSIVHILAIQNIMNLIQSLRGNSPKATNQMCTFILEYLCADCNINASWPEEESMKYTIERDLNVLKSFNKLPILWSIFAEALTSKNPELVVIVRAILIVLISYWTTARVVKCSNQPENCQNTVKLLDLLSDVEWLPLPLLNISQIIPIISPYEAKLLLLDIWNHFKFHQPHISPIPVAKYQESLKKTVLTIVQNNIDNIGVTAFLFCRWGLVDTNDN